MSEKQVIINEIKNKIGFYTVVVLTLALVLGFSNNISAKTKIKTRWNHFFTKAPIEKLQTKGIGVCIFQRGSGYVILPVRK